jgi:hypothetical protein
MVFGSPNVLRSLATMAVVVATSSCGLVDSNITDFNLDLPRKSFTIDTANWSVTDAQALVSAPCTVANDMCAAAAAAACTNGDCLAQCNATSLTCDLSLLVGLHAGVNLIMEKPELADINGQPLVDVTIDAITYTVTENTMNVATPEMKVYVAPITMTSPGDALAREIGTVPAIPAGMTLTETAVVLSPTGKATLAQFMGDYQTPFNIIVGSNLLVHNGDPIPAGRMVVSVAVKAHAGV